MRIAHYIDNLRLESGGTVRTVLDLCEELSARGCEIDVYTHDATDAPDHWRSADAPGPRVHELGPTSTPLRKMRKGAAKGLIARLRGADAAHVHGLWEYAAAQFADACAGAGVPYVISAHGMLDDWCMRQGGGKKRAYLRLVLRRRLERAGWVHTTAGAEGEQAKQWIGNGRVAVVPHVFDFGEFKELPGPAAAREAFAMDPRTAHVLFLSRLHPKKGVERLLRMAKAMRDAGSDAQILIAGTGDAPYVAQLEALHRELELGKSVRFVGMVTGSLKISLYQATDLFVLPTSQENWGFVFFESLACGTPVVTTRGVDAWPEIEASGAGEIVETETPPKELASRVIGLLGDRAALDRRGEGAREWVMRELHSDRTVARFLDLYRSAGDRAAQLPATIGHAEPSANHA